MKWQNCFEKYHYISMFTRNSGVGKICNKLDLSFFLNEDGSKPDVLRDIYLSECEDELYFIFQPQPGTDIKRFCDDWDTHILEYINFGDVPQLDLKFKLRFKYNIIQILLYGNANKIQAGGHVLMEPPDNFSEEKSTFVSRKIFVQCGENDVIGQDSSLLLPFWYDELEEVNLEKHNEEKLTKLLPHEPGLEFLYNKKEKSKRSEKKEASNEFIFNESEFEGVRSWLEK